MRSYFHERQLMSDVGIYLQRLEADEACDSEAVDDVFLAGHGLSLPPTRRPMSPKHGPTFSPTRTQDVIRPATLSVGARGQGCGPLLGQVHSPPPPQLPVALRTGPSALSHSSASARTLHPPRPPSFVTPTGPKALYFNPGPAEGTEP